MNAPSRVLNHATMTLDLVCMYRYTDIVQMVHMHQLRYNYNILNAFCIFASSHMKYIVMNISIGVTMVTMATDKVTILHLPRNYPVVFTLHKLFPPLLGENYSCSLV